MAISKITIGEDCTACSLCEDTAPDVFEMSGEIAKVKAGADLNANEDKIKEAAESCPVETIKVE